jgi:tRNA(Ile)-lysidine synthetase-like protein
LPALRDRLPEVEARLVRVAVQAAADRAAWDAALDVMPGLDFRREIDGISVVAPLLAGYDSALAGAVLRALARRAGLTVGAARTRRILALAAAGRSGSATPLADGWHAELQFGRLHLVRPGAGRAGAGPDAWSLEGSAGEHRWGDRLLRWRREPAPARQPRDGGTAWLALAAEVAAPLTVRSWRPGDRIRPLGGLGSRLVVRCLQEARVPRGRRAGWPVLESEGKVLWVPGVCRSDGEVPLEGTEALRVDVVDLATG